jgi:type I restriction enzyme M protein
VLPEDDDPEAATDLGNTLLELLPGDGGSQGNQAALEALRRASGAEVSQEADEAAREQLTTMGLIRKGRGRGGSAWNATSSAPSSLSAWATRPCAKA